MLNGSRRKKINLALQGGGAYGAFTWGVLDHMLEDGRIEIEGITGASAGAVNAIMLADGLARGGPEEARRRLADFWRATSLGGNLPDAQRKAVDRLFWFLPFEDSPLGIWFKAVSHYLSPYDFNPLNINPLKELIERFVDFEAVRKCQIPQVFVSATNVHPIPTTIFSKCFMIVVATQHAASSTAISTTSARATRSIWRKRCRPSGRDRPNTGSSPSHRIVI